MPAPPSGLFASREQATPYAPDHDAYLALAAHAADPAASDLSRALADAQLAWLAGTAPSSADWFASARVAGWAHLPAHEQGLAAVGLVHGLSLTRGFMPDAVWDETASRAVEDIDALLGALAAADYASMVIGHCVRLAAGLVLGLPDQVDAALAAARAMVDDGDIRPQGHIAGAVQPDRASKLSAFARQVLCTKALVLMAEMAAQAEIDLWGYSVRGVSVSTAAMYPIYFFYTVKKWKHDAALTTDETQRALRSHGGWIEMAARKLDHRDLYTLLADLRPVWDATGGGMTTLTHPQREKPKRRGLFG
jgi:hypothetical protein